MTVPNESGSLCAYAINAAKNGNNPLIGCKFVNTNPFGSMDGAGRSNGGVRVRGWALDPDTTGAVGVHVYVDGRPVAALTANNSRADIGAAFRAYSASHAFDATVPLGPGGARRVHLRHQPGLRLLQPAPRLPRRRLTATTITASSTAGPASVGARPRPHRPTFTVLAHATGDCRW